MTIREKNKVLSEIWDKLDYWCEQYKIANNVNHDLSECERISKNIRKLERAFKTIKTLF